MHDHLPLCSVCTNVSDRPSPANIANRLVEKGLISHFFKFFGNRTGRLWMHFWLRFSWQKLLQVILHILVRIFGRLNTKLSLTKRPHFFKYILLDLGR